MNIDFWLEQILRTLSAKWRTERVPESMLLKHMTLLSRIIYLFGIRLRKKICIQRKNIEENVRWPAAKVEDTHYRQHWWQHFQNLDPVQEQDLREEEEKT